MDVQPVCIYSVKLQAVVFISSVISAVARLDSILWRRLWQMIMILIYKPVIDDNDSHSHWVWGKRPPLGSDIPPHIFQSKIKTPLDKGSEAQLKF